MPELENNNPYCLRIMLKDECYGCHIRSECPQRESTVHFHSRLNDFKKSVIIQYFLVTWPEILDIDIYCGILAGSRKEFKDPWIYYAFDCAVCGKKDSCTWQDKVSSWRSNKDEIYSTMESFSACFLIGNYDLAIKCHDFSSPQKIHETIL